MPSTIVSLHLPILITRVFGKIKQTTVIIKEFSPCYDVIETININHIFP
jgi:hypothetical protein